ncbi:unnamed protein product [Peniophora sp. CBMAI 1063]|nr:unnamed protein product [Peniophora sp. CBMAI 1063]
MGDPASNETLLILQNEFVDLIRLQVYPVIIETLLFGLHMTLAMYLLWRRWTQRNSISLKTYVPLVAFAMTAMLSARWAIDAYYLLASALNSYSRVVVLLDPDLTNPELQYGRGVDIARNALTCGILLLGDCVVLWRAYALFGRPKWLLVLSISVQLGVASVYLWFSFGTISLFALVVAVVPDSLATSLIAYRTWSHWKDIREFSEHSGTRQSVAIMLVVIESGFLYLILTVCLVICIMLDGAASIWARYMLNPLFAMYPVVVVLLVATRRDFLERSVNTTSPTSLPWAVEISFRERNDGDLRSCGGPAAGRHRSSLSCSVTTQNMITHAKDDLKDPSIPPSSGRDGSLIPSP